MTRPQTIRSELEDPQEYIAILAQQNNHQTSLHSFRGALSHPAQSLEESQGLSAEVEENKHNSSTLMDWNTGEKQQPINQNENEASISSSNYYNRKSNTHNSSSSGNQIEAQAESIYKDLEARNAEVNDVLDDDMMDRISSSPSIADGRYFPIRPGHLKPVSR
ncbi:hypothetical protein Golomagni_00805 [Golovinomyces magnicellulatus]|nr:hypothetical protein Golomagni_00805 [Golovinomyces magnicellulatus]